ncbi:MAG TPA: class I tRNA ligase family protein, partial [Candidatus Krumholzibacterium sp.]|nr:class I tRNA ligase family protein [Candidatus Krumholzibacterium sp.]
HEFCDWYLELSKPAFREGGARSVGAAMTGRAVLGVSMMMLHPVMPFISEEIWSMLSPDAPLLASYRIRGLDESHIDPALEEDVSMFREIVTSIRNLRQSFNIPPQQETAVVISTEPGKGIPARLEPLRDQITTLARVSELKIADDAPKPARCAAAGHTNINIYLPLEGLVDITSEKERITKELDKLVMESEKTAARLEDSKFTDRAPAHVVQKERERFEDMDDRRRRLEKILEDLQ